MMSDTIKNQKRDEMVAGELRGLFERRGFRRVSVGKFEDYGLYIDNKNFLASEHIITFMDMDGKLLALKPDVTLSIVKNIPKNELSAAEKLYYADEVYRLSKENREYKVVSQIGVELIGRPNPFSGIEVVDLALEALALISGEFVLDISHLGFVSGLLEEAGLSPSAQSRVMAALHTKSLHDIGPVLCEAEISEEHKNRVLRLCGLRGSLSGALTEAGGLVLNSAMNEAYRELCDIEAVLRADGAASHVNLDFSVVNDLDYYNGLVFTGYVKGVPQAVLTGGRYDNLMRKMGKKSGAIGFAVYLSELGAYFKSGKRHDFDILITYDDDCDRAALLATAKELSSGGDSVRLEHAGSDMKLAGLSFGKRFHYEKGVLREAEE